MTTRRFLTLVLICLFRVVTVSQEQGRPPFRDTGLRPEERAANLVSRLTLEEKAAQLKDVAVAIPRLGVPAYNWWNEGLHGVARAGEATVFPQAIGLAATWDEPLVHEVADVLSHVNSAPSMPRR